MIPGVVKEKEDRMTKTRRSNKTYGLKKTKMRVILKPDGVSEQVLAPQKSLDESLDEIESFARGVLKDGGLSTNWLDHIQKEHPEIPERCSHAVFLLSRLHQVRNWLKFNKAGPAVFETMNMMRAMQDLVLTDMEPDIYRGKESIKYSSRGGEARAAEYSKGKISWQPRAKKIWEDHSEYSVAQVAKIIEKETGISWESIRKHIKKPKNTLKSKGK